MLARALLASIADNADYISQKHTKQRRGNTTAQQAHKTTSGQHGNVVATRRHNEHGAQHARAAQHDAAQNTQCTTGGRDQRQGA